MIAAYTTDRPTRMIQSPGPKGNRKNRAAAAQRKAQARRKFLRNGATLQPSSVITTALILVSTPFLSWRERSRDGSCHRR